MSEEIKKGNALRVGIIYWSGIGNTERMASLIAAGAESSGADVTIKNVADASPDELDRYDAVALGSPAMSSECVEEGEMAVFSRDAIQYLAGKPTGLFGSYGWGDGEWMRKWADEMRRAGAHVIDDGLAVRESPEGESADKCAEFGSKLAGAGKRITFV